MSEAEVFCAGDSNVSRLRAVNVNPNWTFHGISSGNILTGEDTLIEEIRRHIPRGEINLVLWWGNEIDGLSKELSSTSILEGHDLIASKLYNGFLGKRRLRRKDPLQILKLYTGRLLDEAESFVKKYIKKLSEIIHACDRRSKILQTTIILNGPRCKKNKYEDVLVNLLIYFLNHKLKEIIEKEPHKICTWTQLKYIDFFFPFVTGGRWNDSTRLDLHPEHERSLSKWYGAAHYDPSVYHELLDFIER